MPQANDRNERTDRDTAGATPVDEGLEYAGFWIRVGAALIDTMLFTALVVPVLFAIYGRSYFETSRAGSVTGLADMLLSWLAPAIAVIAFWLYRQATPGKMALSIRVVDAGTGQTLSFGQSIGRYLGYFVSTIPFGLGLLWVGIDRRKQGWHDKLAGSVVVRNRRPQPVRFDAG